MHATRLFHAGPDGTLWSLERADGQVRVLRARGGEAEGLDLAAFLGGDPAAPERRAFHDLVATLIEAQAPAVGGAPPEAGAAAAEPSPGEEVA